MMQAILLASASALTPLPSSLSALSRRAVFVPAAAAVFTALPVPRASAETTLEPYTDPRYGVSFGIPTGWAVAPSKELPDGRRLVIATDPKDESNNVFISFTPIRPDYNTLGSFGTIDFVANTVLPQCGDLSYACSFAKGDGIDAQMLSKDTDKKGNYIYDYTIEQRGGPKRHLRSLFTVQADGAANIIVGLTAQSLDSGYKELEPTFKAVLASYKSK